jgi:hypothetical protein
MAIGLGALVVMTQLPSNPQYYLEYVVFLILLWVLLGRGVLFLLLAFLFRTGIAFGFGIIILLCSFWIPTEFVLTLFTGNQTTGTPDELLLTPIMLLIGRWVTLVGWRAWREGRTQAKQPAA